MNTTEGLLKALSECDGNTQMKSHEDHDLGEVLDAFAEPDKPEHIMRFSDGTTGTVSL